MPELKAIVESILFVSDAPVSLDRLCSVLEEFERADIREAVTLLASEYDERRGGIVLREVAGGYQFRTTADTSEYLRRLNRSRSTKFSQSALESLAIIAYRQPITRAELEYLRGVDSGGVVRTLLERRLIRILGKKDVPGKPLLYGTSKEFLEVFGLRDLSALPTLREITDLSQVPSFEEQQELPLEEEGLSEGS